jgi:large subunit ribosomal protein L6
VLKEIEKKIEIPKELEFELNGKTLTLKGPKGSVSKSFKASGIAFIKKENCLLLKSPKGSKKTNAVITAVASHVKNMVEGLKKGYEYRLAIVYSHFPMNVLVKGNTVEINNFTGEKKTRTAKIIGDTKVEVKGKEIIVTGLNKEEVGQTAANIEQATRGKKIDSRVFQDGIYLIKKGVLSE